MLTDISPRPQLFTFVKASLNLKEYIFRSSYGKKHIPSLDTEKVDNELKTEQESAVKVKDHQFKQKDTDHQMFGHPGAWHRVEFSSGKEALI